MATGAFMGALVCGLDVQPGCAPIVATSELRLFGDVTWKDAFFGVFLLMHHYFIDQFMWRLTRDSALRRDLRLAA